MGKVTKRARKFNAKGGVKAALGKGTITKKGKLRKRTTKSAGVPQAKARPSPSESLVDRDDDYAGTKNIGDLDIDDFFTMASGELEGEAASDSSSSEDSEKESDVEGKMDDGSDSSSDEDEDVEAAEEKMKEEMLKLQEKDPEFHDFLRENEDSLLEFGAEDDGAPQSNEKDDDEDEDTKNKSKGKNGSIVLTVKLLKTLYHGSFSGHRVKQLKKLVAAYHSACHMAESADSGASEKGGRGYVIESSKVFDQLMMMCLNRCHDEFRYHLGLDDDANDDDDHKDSPPDASPIHPNKLEKSDNWEELRPIMTSFFRSTLHLLDEAKEAQLITVILKALSHYIPFLSAFDRIGEKMLKTLTQLWSAPLDSSEDFQVVRLNAFFRIRQLALTQPFPFIEACLKKTYLAYLRRARFGNSSTFLTAMPTLTFMGNCLVELYSLDLQSSYQHAFVYIRQLALLLRGALQKKTTEAFQQVFCWQYVHCLKLWTAVLSQNVAEEDNSMLRSLLFPLSEIILGVCRIMPSPVRLAPMRFHCIRLLQQLAASAENFVPTTSIILECLDWKEWHLSPKKIKRASGAIHAIQLPYMVKFNKDDALRTTEQLEPAISELFTLIQREIELYRYSAGFPEFSYRIVHRLKAFAKETRVARWRAYARGCIDTCENYKAFALRERAKLQEAPKDVSRLECLRPPTAPSMKERHDAAIEKESRAIQANREDQPSVGKRKADNDDADAPGNKESKSAKKRRKKREAAGRKRASMIEKGESAGQSLDQDDEVEEGVDWSDEE